MPNQRRRIKQEVPLRQRLALEALKLKETAKAIRRPSVKRERLMARARQLEIAAQIDHWVSSTGLDFPE
jgi:hypothetical protein